MNSDGFGQPGVGYDSSLTTGVQNCNEKNPNLILGVKREMFKGGQLNKRPVCRQTSQMHVLGPPGGDLVWNLNLVHSN